MVVLSVRATPCNLLEVVVAFEYNSAPGCPCATNLHMNLLNAPSNILDSNSICILTNRLPPVAGNSIPMLIRSDLVSPNFKISLSIMPCHSFCQATESGPVRIRAFQHALLP